MGIWGTLTVLRYWKEEASNSRVQVSLQWEVLGKLT